LPERVDDQVELSPDTLEHLQRIVRIEIARAPEVDPSCGRLIADYLSIASSLDIAHIAPNALPHLSQALAESGLPMTPLHKICLQ